MAPEISEMNEPATLDDGGVPFEAPPGRVVVPRPRKRKPKRGSFVGVLAIIYAIGAVGVGAVDRGGAYLLSWLVTGPLLYAAVRAFRRRRDGAPRS